MTDELEKKLREIRDRNSRKYSEQEELKDEIQKLRDEVNELKNDKALTTGADVIGHIEKMYVTSLNKQKIYLPEASYSKTVDYFTGI